MLSYWNFSLLLLQQNVFRKYDRLTFRRALIMSSPIAAHMQLPQFEWSKYGHLIKPQNVN